MVAHGSPIYIYDITVFVDLIYVHRCPISLLASMQLLLPLVPAQG